jgi:outer membrane lipoprotein-sorting protein
MKTLSQIRLIFVLLAAMFIMPLTTIAAAKTVSDQAQAEKILQKYNKKSGVQIKLDMQTEKKVLGTKTSDKGLMTHQTGKINLAIEGEKKSEMIFDGKKAYLIAYPDQELDPDGKRKVILLKVNSKNQLGLLSDLFGQPKKFFANFKTKTVSSDSKSLILKLEDKAKTLKDMTLEFSKEDKTLTQLSYTDDVGSEIKINFEKPSFTTEISAKLFKYNSLKSDEVVSQ